MISAAAVHFLCGAMAARLTSNQKVTGSSPVMESSIEENDNVAEWLRRWIANPLLFERVSSNLTTVVFCKFLLSRSDKYPKS